MAGDLAWQYRHACTLAEGPTLKRVNHVEKLAGTL